MSSKSQAAAGAIALLLLLVAPPLLAPPAGAIGPVLSLNVTPPRGFGAPSPDMDGEANFTAEINVLSDPVGRAQLVVTVTDTLGWTISPSSYQWPITTGGRFVLNFTVTVPNDVPADTSDTVNVDASYRAAGVTVSSVSQSVYAVAGEYRGGAVKRVTPSEKMAVGKTYLIEYDVANTGNSGSTFVFRWADEALNSRLKASFTLPQSLSLAGFNNSTAQFRVTPQATTPAGTFQVPVVMVVTDRTGETRASVNFTVEIVFDNIPVYPGFLPRYDLTMPAAYLAWGAVLFTFWFALQALFAFPARHRFDAADGSRYLQALNARLRRSLLGKLAARVFRGRGPRPGGGAPGKRPPRPARALADEE